MSQNHSEDTQAGSQPQAWNWPGGELPVAEGLLAGALLCAGCAALGWLPWLTFILCVLFAGASMWLLRQTRKQEREKEQSWFIELASVCQDQLDGEGRQRAQEPEGESGVERQLFIKILNQVLDGYAFLHTDNQARRLELAGLQDQMELLLYEMQPVASGDLRTRSSVIDGTPGQVALLCNTLVEDTAQLVQWAQYMANQIIQTAHSLMDHLLELTQSIEQAVHRQEEMSETLEWLLALTLRMESAFYAYAELSRPLLSRTISHTQGLPQEVETLSPFYQRSQEQPAQSLNDLQRLVHETTTRVEQIKRELVLRAQDFQQMHGETVQLTGIINSLTSLAENWRQAAEQYALPTPTGAYKRIVETVPAELS